MIDSDVGGAGVYETYERQELVKTVVSLSNEVQSLREERERYRDLFHQMLKICGTLDELEGRRDEAIKEDLRRS